MRKLTPKQDKFAQQVVLNDGDKVQAFKDAGYAWKKYGSLALAVQADKTYNIPKINLKIEELKKQKTVVAKVKFDIDAEWVLNKAVDILDKCMATDKFHPQGANKALELIGKNVGVNAFSEHVKVDANVHVKKGFKDFYDDIKEDDEK